MSSDQLSADEGPAKGHALAAGLLFHRVDVDSAFGAVIVAVFGPRVVVAE